MNHSSQTFQYWYFQKRKLDFFLYLSSSVICYQLDRSISGTSVLLGRKNKRLEKLLWCFLLMKIFNIQSSGEQAWLHVSVPSHIVSKQLPKYPFNEIFRIFSVMWDITQYKKKFRVRHPVSLFDDPGSTPGLALSRLSWLLYTNIEGTIWPAWHQVSFLGS